MKTTTNYEGSLPWCTKWLAITALTYDNDRWWWPWILLFWWWWWLLLWSSSSSLSSCSFNRLFICYTNLASESEPSRNQWPKFGVPKESLFVRLTHERFYFINWITKINWNLLMLKIIFFCTVAWSILIYFIHIQGQTVKNCSEIDCTLYLNHLGTSGKNLVSLRKDHLSDWLMKEFFFNWFKKLT